MPRYPFLDRGKLDALAIWAADTKHLTRAAWRKDAVDPSKLEDQLEDYPGALGDKEIRFCLGWAELAWAEYANQGDPWDGNPPGTVDDNKLCIAILKAKNKRGPGG